MRYKRFFVFILFSTALSFFSAASATEADTVCLPIVMYHQINNRYLGKDVITPEEFESDLNYLKMNGYTTITIKELINYCENSGDMPSKPIILSFDDGYLNNYAYVLPLLQKYHMKIVLSLIVKDTEDFTKTPNDNLDYSHLTWQQLGEMVNSGLVEVQNHSYDLHRIRYGRYGCTKISDESPEQYSELITNDLVKAQNEIFRMVGETPSAFSYPYGCYSDRLDSILKELGFKATMTCRYGINYISREKSKDLFRLKHICRSHNYGIGELVNEAIASRL